MCIYLFLEAVLNIEDPFEARTYPLKHQITPAILHSVIMKRNVKAVFLCKKKKVKTSRASSLEIFHSAVSMVTVHISYTLAV